MARGPDQRSVGLRDEELLRRFVACREAGDADGALHWWVKLVEAKFDLVRLLVDRRAAATGCRRRARGGRPAALVKLWKKMVRTFQGTTMGEWVNSTKSLVEVACMDVQRDGRQADRARDVVRHRRPIPSGEPGLAGRRLSARATTRATPSRPTPPDFVAWALPQIADDRRRLVIERTLDGVPAEDIADELGVSMANLYAIRSRGMKDLRKLKDRYEA